MAFPKFTLKLTFETPKKARIIYESVFPEHVASQVRSKCEMDLFENSIVISCVSDELSILKASIYSYLRWIKVAESIYKLTEDE
ncbi:KEOPS complex subunit Pcc1 [Methanococcus maripaludis]|uniref:KEOPS complex subunit Pcc1 n=2 Tax=Methanococcus maripaludis TaxID=39152 RepID=A0A7J9PIB1_METMI|nr:KEOPS complex subunit Pcc1 [Methanococcus maripaludis]MBA2862417.1 KEOPS complex subunit Pcc1 [Methanococcus maripaludis]